MKRHAETLKKYADIIALFGCILLILLGAYHSQYVLNPDGVSYISIAKEYAGGHFWTAVNGYWSPMISWLMVPLLLVGVSGQLSFIIVNTIVALAILLVGLVLIRKRDKSNRVGAYLYLFTMAFFLTHAVGIYITPDLIVVLWVLLFLFALLHGDKYLKAKSGRQKVCFALLLGALGALGYVTKLFLLPFFILSIALWWLFQLFSQRIFRKREGVLDKLKEVSLFPLMVLGFLVLFMAPWAALISAKYEKPTIGSAFSYNVTAKNPHYPGQPVTYKLIPPPNEYANDAWEDPTVLPYDKFSHGSTIAFVKNYVKNRLQQFPTLLGSINAPLPLTAGLFMGAIGLAIAFSRLKKYRVIVYGSILMVSYTFGYALIASSNARYLWPVFVITILSCSTLCSSAFISLRGGGGTRRRWALIISAVIVSVVALLVNVPAPKALFGPPKPDAVRTAAIKINHKRLIPHHARIASNAFKYSSDLGYYLDAKSYGVVSLSTTTSVHAIGTQLAVNGIKYYIPVTTKEAGKNYKSLGDTLYEAPLYGRHACHEAGKNCLYVIVIETST